MLRNFLRLRLRETAYPYNSASEKVTNFRLNVQTSNCPRLWLVWAWRLLEDTVDRRKNRMIVIAGQCSMHQLRPGIAITLATGPSTVHWHQHWSPASEGSTASVVLMVGSGSSYGAGEAHLDGQRCTTEERIKRRDSIDHGRKFTPRVTVVDLQ
jgi:hypothetical protein